MIPAQRGGSTPQFRLVFPCFPFVCPCLGVSANEAFFFFFHFPLSLFSLMPGCSGDSDSWPCLHQVRCISFYFVFHQLWLHKTPLVSGDRCQKLQSPLLWAHLLASSPTPITHPPTDRHVMKRGVSVGRSMVLTLLPVAFVPFSGHYFSGSQSLTCKLG